MQAQILNDEIETVQSLHARLTRFVEGSKQDYYTPSERLELLEAAGGVALRLHHLINLEVSNTRSPRVSGGHQ